MANLVVPKGTETTVQKEINEAGKILIELDIARRDAEILLVKANTDCAVLEREFKRVKLFKLMAGTAKDFAKVNPEIVTKALRDRIANALAVSLIGLTRTVSPSLEGKAGATDGK